MYDGSQMWCYNSINEIEGHLGKKRLCPCFGKPTALYLIVNRSLKCAGVYKKICFSQLIVLVKDEDSGLQLRQKHYVTHLE